MKRKPKKKCRGEVGCCSKMLSKETIPRHFYMPITQAAKEPNLGTTPLKKRCKEPDPRLALLEEKVQRVGRGGASV